MVTLLRYRPPDRPFTSPYRGDHSRGERGLSYTHRTNERFHSIALLIMRIVFGEISGGIKVRLVQKAGDEEAEKKSKKQPARRVMTNSKVKCRRVVPINNFLLCRAARVMVTVFSVLLMKFFKSAYINERQNWLIQGAITRRTGNSGC